MSAEDKTEFDKLAEKFDKVAAEIKAENKAEFEKLSTYIDDVAIRFIPIYLFLTAVAYATGMAKAKTS